MRITVLAVVLFAVTAAGCGPRGALGESEAPVVTFKEASANNVVFFEVSNPNNHRVPYFGYEGGFSPLYEVEVRTGTVWKAKNPGWCGTGTGPVTLAAKEKATFGAQLPEGEWDEVRVGIVWYRSRDRNDSETAWSEPVPRAAAKPTT